MKNVCGSHLTAGMLSQNFNETIKSFVTNDKPYQFMNTVKGIPTYWKKNHF